MKFLQNIKKIVICFALLITTFIYPTRSTKQLLATADLLTKISYTAQMQENLLTFTAKNFDTDANLANIENLPSIEEIVTQIAMIQKWQKSLDKNPFNDQLIKTLDDAIFATNKALSIANLYCDLPANITTENQQILLPVIMHVDPKLIAILHNQKQLLQNKKTELNQKSRATYFSQPSIMYAAIAISLVVLASTTYHYFNLDTIKNNIIFFNRTSDREHLEYIKIRSIFAQLVQPGEKQHLSVYLQQAKEIKPKLDPIDHKDIIEFLDTFLKARDPKNLKSWVFLAQAQRNEKRFTQTFINVLNSDSATKAQSPNGTSWLPENVNLREMIQQIQSAKK